MYICLQPIQDEKGQKKRVACCICTKTTVLNPFLSYPTSLKNQSSQNAIRKLQSVHVYLKIKKRGPKYNNREKKRERVLYILDPEGEESVGTIRSVVCVTSKEREEDMNCRRLYEFYAQLLIHGLEGLGFVC